STFPSNEQLPRVDVLLLTRSDGRAVGKQTSDQQCFQEAELVLVDTDGIRDVQIERAHLHILDTVLAQRDQGPVLCGLPRLRSYCAVVLVLDLQDIGVELTVLA